MKKLDLIVLFLIDSKSSVIVLMMLINVCPMSEVSLTNVNGLPVPVLILRRDVVSVLIWGEIRWNLINPISVFPPTCTTPFKGPLVCPLLPSFDKTGVHDTKPKLPVLDGNKD